MSAYYVTPSRLLRDNYNGVVRRGSFYGKMYADSNFYLIIKVNQYIVS
jgi:hypothetical protein